MLAALGDGAYLVEPPWWSPMNKTLLMVFALFYLVMMPFLKPKWALLGTAMLLGAVIVVQIGAQIFMGFWLTGANLLVYIVTAYALMFMWILRTKMHKLTLDRADSSSITLATHYYANGTLDKAFEYAKTCRTSETVLKTLYEIGLAREKQGESQLAYECYREVLSRKRKYEDLNVRVREIEKKLEVNKKTSSNLIKKLKRSSPRLKKTGHSPQLEKTQVLPELTPTLTKLGRYEIIKELGRGASGTVYLSFDPLISRQVAVKTLNYHQFSTGELKDIKLRFVREAEAAGRLSHPNIVPVFDVGEDGETAYIAMDFARGKALSEYIAPDKLLPVFDVYRIVYHIAEALAYAHNTKIVHRDIKPGNILFCADPFQVKVTDFGIARFVDHSHTRTGEILGSPLYMAPEQLLGKKVNFSSDIFSLGVMFYQLITGALPFTGDSLASLTYEIVHSKHKSARSIRKSLPASATRITNLALQKAPTDRYASATEMAEALRNAIKRDFPAEAKSNGFY